MTMRDPQTTTHDSGIVKCPTGIEGLDQITGGGLPCGRSILVSGGAGCGKTILAVEFLAHGARRFGEPGLFISFEETAEEILQNFRSFGFDLEALSEQNLLAMEHIHIDRSEIEETGEYNLEGLFIRLGAAIDAIGAKRIVLDTIETIFAGFSNITILRAELRRLFRWLKHKGVTAIVTAERGENSLMKQDLEEYVSDCVIYLDHRVREQISTRRLRVVKYRGSSHGSNEYPFLIEERGLSVLPLSSLGLDYPVSSARVTTGIARLDEMLGGEGYYRSSSILVSGTAGTGKSSSAAHFADATCRRGERCLYFAFEESEKQVIRNMRSIGIDLAFWVEKGLLQIHAMRPTMFGLEMHLLSIYRMVEEFRPSAVIIDPISNFIASGTLLDVKAMLVRLIDFLKMNQVTAMLTCLTSSTTLEDSEVNISSLIDTWIQVRNFESGGERNLGLYVLKSRGMAHSNQVREFVITSKGIDLVNIELGPDGVLIGSARLAQAALDEEESQLRKHAIERLQRSVECKRSALQAQISVLQSELSSQEEELQQRIAEEQQRELHRREGQAEILSRRSGLGERSAAAASPQEGQI